MSIMEPLFKRNAELIGTERGVKQSVKVAFVKVITVRLTMLGHTELVDSGAYRPEWSAVLQTVVVSLNALR